MKAFEKHIKEKLETREITPSEGAWAKLENRLETKKQASKKPYWWIGIAAAFLLGLLISNLVFTNQNPKATSPVATDGSIDFDKAKAPTKVVPVPKTAPKHSEVQVAETVPHINKESPQATPQNEPVQLAAVKEVATSEPVQNGVEVHPKVQPKSNYENPTLNPKKAVATTNDSSEWYQEAGAVSDAEVNALLHQAQLRIRGKAALDASKNIVDADALLREVEQKTDKPLKERVFKAIKGGIHHIGALLASRH